MAPCNEGDVQAELLDSSKRKELAIDEYVESMVVKPMKEYSKKHTMLSMLQKINMNLEIFKHIRQVNMKGFDVH